RTCGWITSFLKTLAEGTRLSRGMAAQSGSHGPAFGWFLALRVLARLTRCQRNCSRHSRPGDLMVSGAFFLIREVARAPGENGFIAGGRGRTSVVEAGKASRGRAEAERPRRQNGEVSAVPSPHMASGAEFSEVRGAGYRNGKIARASSGIPVLNVVEGRHRAPISN